jgi:asparagine N-glycosylation enzyme membrane subunit Stt3
MEMVRLKKSRIFDIVFWFLVISFILVSWWLRAGLPVADLISGTECKLADVDAYYHLWQADYIYDNWPNVERETKMLMWPEGQEVGQRPLNAWLMATVAKFSGQTTEWVALYFPAVMGILSLLGVLGIAWVLWNRWAGLIAVSILSVIPGEYYGRLALGVSDQHAVEVVLMMFFVLFYLLSIHKHWGWSFLSGLCMVLYVMNWAGAPVLIICVLVFLVIQSIINQYRIIANTRMLCLITFIPLVMGFCVFMAFRSDEMTYAMFYGASALAPAIVANVSKYTSKFKPYWYAVILFGVVGICLLGLWLWQPTMTKYAFLVREGFLGAVGASSSSLGRTISEVQPILMPYGKFTLDVIWGVFGLTFITGLAGMILVFWHMKRPIDVYIVIWAWFLLIITFMQRRYGYYSACSLALFTGYLIWFIIEKLAVHKYTKKEIKKGKVGQSTNPVIVLLGSILVMVAFLIPNYMLTSKEALKHPYAPSGAWMDALEYLRTKTPQTNDYGVIAWWDYGYWIVREGQRPVPCHPGGGSTDKVAKFFTSMTTQEANKYAKELKCDYVVIDFQTAKHKWYAIPILAGKGQLTEKQYNDCMLARLYYSKEGIEGYVRVFDSKETYDKIPQVRIFKRYDVVEHCPCGGK